jgi:hypothetical protein
VPQRHHGIDAHRPTRGNVARDHRDQREQDREAGIAEEVGPADAVKVNGGARLADGSGREQARQRERGGDPEPDPNACEQRRALEHEPENGAAIGA